MSEAAPTQWGSDVRRGTGSTAVVALLCGLLSGCVPQGLAFRVDNRLSITSPKDRSEVTLPLTVSWTVRDFTIDRSGAPGSRNTGYFAVFVDREPQPPGKPLSWLARKDRNCRAADGCPDAQYLAARGVYSTTDTHITFDQLPRPSSDSHQKERHGITVVLLDPAGKRIGESAFQVDVVVNRRGSQ